MNPTQDPQEYPEFTAQPIQPRKVGFWANIGGGSLTIAILVHLVLLIAGAFMVFQYIHPEKRDPDFGLKEGGGGPSSAQCAEHQMQKKRAQASATSNVARTFAEGAITPFVMPERGIEIGEMTSLASLTGGGSSGDMSSLGEGGGIGHGRGPGKGDGLFPGGGGNRDGRFIDLIPPVIGQRCSKEERLQRLKDNGGSPACEEAVVNGLRWLKEHQNSDGSWGSSRNVAMTGLALLAYFGHCETPMSEEFGDSCTRGIVYLVNIALKNDGRLANNFSEKSWCYEHAIGTYALGEAATFCKDLKIDVPFLMEMTQKAGQFIIDNQNANGGWAYSYDRSEGHVDVSVTGWQVQALKACEHSGLKFNGMNGTIDQALRWLDKCQDDNGGYGYTGPKPAGEVNYYTLTGVGMLCNQMWGKGSRSEVRKAARYITANSKFDYNTEFADLYGHYYESQAMMQSGGADWTFYNAMFRDQLLKNQNADGSWKSPGGGRKIVAVGAAYVGESGDAKVYRTSLCSLMLEVYYRFLSTGGGHGTRSKLGI